VRAWCIALEQDSELKKGPRRRVVEAQDYYEFLQISPSAEPDTIHRVYRFLVARFHPDNHDTGDAEKFFLLTQAYEVLSNPERRAAYDAKRQASQLVPLSTSIDFMDSIKGELNRRLAMLAVLYFQRRTNPYAPEVSLRDIERRLGFPRDYLEFTAWYLCTKEYITRADNSDFTITAAGVDFVETQRVNIPVLDKLLTATSEASHATTGGATAKPEEFLRN
jgi:curved DNA-binding protein CbpA